MARLPISDYWKQLVHITTENERELSAAALARRLEARGKEENRDDYPGERWIRREQQEFRSRQPAERVKYRLFYWPESMESGVLPWEASADALTLLRYYHHDQHVGRPLLSVVKWFWRVSQTAPDSSVQMRESLARQLAASEIVGSLQEVSRGIEWLLAYGPWRSDEDTRAYADAERYEATAPPLAVPWSPELIPPYPAASYTGEIRLALPAGTDLETVLDAFDAMQGVAMSERARSATRDILQSKWKMTDTLENGDK